jgi:hypothetical protein
MVKRGTIVFIMLALFAQVVPLFGQKEPAQKMGIRLQTLQRLYLVSVGLSLSTSADPLFIPYCEKTESGETVLCTLAAHLEVQTPRGWRKAEVRDATVATRDPRKAEGSLIPPRSKRYAIFYFNTDVYGIPPGTRLRVVVDAWPNEESMRGGAPPTQVTSPEFVCPPQVGWR